MRLVHFPDRTLSPPLSIHITRLDSLRAPLRMDTPAAIAHAHAMRRALGLPGGQLVANPDLPAPQGNLMATIVSSVMGGEQQAIILFLLGGLASDVLRRRWLLVGGLGALGALRRRA